MAHIFSLINYLCEPGHSISYQHRDQMMVPGNFQDQPLGVWDPMSSLPKTTDPHAACASARLASASPPCCPSLDTIFWCHSYLPSEEPANSDDAQDIKHCRAHNGPNSHVTLGDEDTWNTDRTSAWLLWPVVFQGVCKGDFLSVRLFIENLWETVED